MIKIADSEIAVHKIAVHKKADAKKGLFIGNQLGLVPVYTSVESDKKSLDWF